MNKDQFAYLNQENESLRSQVKELTALAEKYREGIEDIRHMAYGKPPFDIDAGHHAIWSTADKLLSLPFPKVEG